MAISRTLLVAFIISALGFLTPDFCVKAFAPAPAGSVTAVRQRYPRIPLLNNSGSVRDNSSVLYANKNDQNDNNESDWFSRRIERATFSSIYRDAILIACYVLCRFFVYDISTGIKDTPGWELQDVAYLTGTTSSAIVLICYWTIAGLLTRSFETLRAGTELQWPIQVLVNVALTCPIWLATEHFLDFGPSDVGGTTLDQAVVNGFVGLTFAMLFGRAISSKFEEE